MAITVRELVGLPHLRLDTLAGSAGLDHVVTWAHSSDLEEPWGWLSGGELLMKNGRTFPRREHQQVDFIRGLAAAHASALVIGSDPESPQVSEGALRCADDLEMPVLSVPYSMSFIVLSRAVADALLSEEASRIARTEKIYNTIHGAVAGNAPGQFLALLKAELSCDLYIIDSQTLHPILIGTPPLPSALRDRIRDEIETAHGSFPGALRFVGPGRMKVAVAEVPYEEPTFLVATFGGRQPPDLELLQHAATAVAVEVAHASLRSENQRQLGTELLANLIERRLDFASSAAQLRHHGLSAPSSRLLAIQGADVNVERRVHIGLRRREVAHLLLRREQVLFLLLEEGPDAAQNDASLAMGLVLARLGQGCVVGVSSPLGDPARMPAATSEALWALAGATSESPAVKYEDASPLPALHSQEEAHALISRVLGPLIEYDTANGTDLVRSLSAFFAVQRSWQRCADVLHVHRQTVIYRMRRVEEITGRTLSETEDISILWLALRAHEILYAHVPSISATYGNRDPGAALGDVSARSDR
ncbi:MAG: PucR family transcriptional regulator ligand-binding domain-containing protein [Acidimicrobiales bacterium]